MSKSMFAVAVSAVALLSLPAFAQQQEIKIGNLLDLTGATSSEGKISGPGKVDAIAYVNKTGGINGKKLVSDNIDYSYQAPRSIAQYKKWKQEGYIAIQGYGTADTEALVGFVTEDKMPFWSLSYSGHLTDPQGKGPKGSKPTPYNFFSGPSYSDGARALVQWAADDWKKKGGKGKPKYVHMGDNHPYPNAPKAAAEDYAKELGFDIGTPIQYALAGGDFKAQCLALKESGANYAFLANTSGANIALLRSCQTVGVDVQFLSNVWGMNEVSMKAAGKAVDGLIAVAGTAAWGADVPGMKVMQEVSKMSDPTGKEYRALPYARAACGVFYMAEAMKWADQNGGITGENIRKGMYQKKNWVPYGLDGVCGPGTWTDSDHRGVTSIGLYQVSIKGPTEQGEVGDLMRNGTMALKTIATIEIPRRPEWLGW